VVAALGWSAVSGRFIAVEGPTGVGKTTLTGRLAPWLGAVAVYDPFDSNPFLVPLLAADRSDEAMALRVELTFLALRVAQLREIAALLAAGRSVVADWALVKQPIFAATTLGKDDAARVAATLDVWTDSLPGPDVLIGLSAPSRIVRQRVHSRGRAMESGLTSGDLDRLAGLFDAAYAARDGPLIRLAAPDFDALEDTHIQALADRIGQLRIPLEAR